MIRPFFFHIGTGSFGGGSKMLLRLLDSLPKDRFDPILLTQRHDRLTQEAVQADIGVQVVPFKNPLNRYNRELFELPAWKKALAGLRILQYNKEVRPILTHVDTIWCQNIRAVLTLLPHAMFTKTPIIWNIGLGMPSNGMMKQLNQLALYISDYVFIESTHQAKRLFTDSQYERFKRKFVVFHKGIDTEKFNPKSTDREMLDTDLNVGTAASLIPRKGLEQFVEAAAQIARENDKVQFYIAGDVPDDRGLSYKKRLLGLIREKDLDDRITLLGWVEDMPEYLNSLDVFVLASKNEGIPGAVREAMAMEVPVVATDVGGTKEAVIDGQVGYLVPPDDSKSITEAVLPLLENAKLRSRMGSRGRKRIVDEFSVEQYVSSYERFLDNISSGEARERTKQAWKPE